jgi:maleylacetoacetate isomerase
MKACRSIFWPARRRIWAIATAIRRGSCRCWRWTAWSLPRAWRSSTISMPRGRSRGSSDAADRAHVLAMALTIACDIHPLNNLRVLKYLSGPLGQPEAARDGWYAQWVAEGLSALEAMAARRAGDYLFGDAPTLADICLVPQLYNARRFSVSLDDFPTLRRADEAANRLEAFAAAHPDVIAAST